MYTFANSEDHDEMLHNAKYQGLRNLDCMSASILHTCDFLFYRV